MRFIDRHNVVMASFVLLLFPMLAAIGGCSGDIRIGSDSGGAGGTSGMGGAGGKGFEWGSSSTSSSSGTGMSGPSVELWSKRFGSWDWNCAYATVVDKSGNVVSIGEASGPIDFGGGPLGTMDLGDIVLAKFDSSGNHLWSKRFGDENHQYGSATVIDSAGNVVIAGYMTGTVDFGGGSLAGGDGAAFVAKFDPNGNHIWSKGFEGSGANDMAIDSAGNVTITGTFGSAVDFGGGALTTAGGGDIFVAQFDPNGNHVWSTRFGGLGADSSTAIATDNAGNMAIVGTFEETVDFGGAPLTTAGGGDIFVVKLDANGNHLWSKRFGDAEDAKEWHSIAIDKAGNVAIAGLFRSTVDFGGGPLTSLDNDDIFAAKFDPNGNHVWSKRFGGDSADGANAVAFDNADNMVITGSFNLVADFGGGPFTSPAPNDPDIFLAKFDPSGNHLWSAQFGGAGSDLALGMAIDNANSVLVTGCFQGTVNFGNGPHVSVGGFDILLAKLMP